MNSLPMPVVSVDLVSLDGLISKVPMESADGRGRGGGSYLGTFLSIPGKIFHLVSTLCS